MTFDVYFKFVNKEGKHCPGVVAHPYDWGQIKSIISQPWVKELVTAIRNGDETKKIDLPAIDWVGKTTTGRRLASACVPTQFVMVDIDHAQDCDGAIQQIKAEIAKDDELFNSVLCIHRTPRLGIRIVFRAVIDKPTLVEHMDWIGEKLNLDQYGDFDKKVKDFSRISFLVPLDDFLYVNEKMMNDEGPKWDLDPIKGDVVQGDEVKPDGTKGKKEEGRLFDNTSVNDFSEEERQQFDAMEYKGTPISVIVDKYVKAKGNPSSGEIHNYYNEMVKNFRTICDNNKRALLYFLPKFGHTADECWSQIVSITRVNTLSRLPKDFYFFLKDHGFYTQAGSDVENMKDYMLSEEETKAERPPYLPPVFKELVGSAPIDFVLPAINSLLPILGTMTSYLKAVYPYDNREHTTSFFSIIYAPASTGKGFVERYMDLLFEDLRLRDYVQSERENVYLRIINRKGDNEKAPDQPHVSLRLIPPKNSEAEFLQKQRDNHGYHMFTYAAEMDSWAKGVRAAGGNKDDMIRVAWDNGEYGQQFKSANTFKGTVRLYWNVLITGTIAQVENYFKNVENGLVSRCSFTSIDNQEFADVPVWKPINKKGMEVIKKFMKRCDERTYEEPCLITVPDIESVSDDDFDKEIDWKFKFRDRQEVDMSWIMPTIKAFHKEQMQKAALDIDRARDVFRRRVGVRGFRLGLICMGLWENPTKQNLEKCKSFVDWWMHKDLESMLRLWGKKYNEQTDNANPVKVQRSVFDQLGESFTKNDVYSVCIKQGIKTPVRRTIFDWKKLGYIESIDKEHFKKKL